MTLSPATLKDFVITTLLAEGRLVDGEWVDRVVSAASAAASMIGQFDIINKEMSRLHVAILEN